MSSGFPTNTILLILVTLVSISAAAWFVLSQAARQTSLAPAAQRAWTWGIAVFLSAWFGALLILAVFPPQEGFFSAPGNWIVSSVGLGMLMGSLALATPSFRQILRAVPLNRLVGVHALRIEGFFFLALLDMRRLPAAFALPAGYGDVTVGVLALGLIVLLGRRTPHVRSLVIAWILLGLLDLISAQVNGILFLGPFAAQAAASGASISYLNYVYLVPSFGVPLLALLHFYTIYLLWSEYSRERKSVVEDRYPQNTLGAKS